MIAEVVEIIETVAESKVIDEVVTKKVGEVVSESVVVSGSEVVEEVVTEMVDEVSEVVVEEVVEVGDQVIPEVVEKVSTDSSAEAEESVTEMIMEEDEEAETSSQPQTRATTLNRDREAGRDNLVADYFADEPVYTDAMFRCRFRMSRQLFLRIAEDLAQSDLFFTLRYDARGRRGFTTLQKCTSAIRQLAYGTAPDSLDEYLRMSERTARECLHRFCEWTVKLYSEKYIQKSNANDV
ncbi:uncharacterized protein LOC118488894 [Helianthus annuus]|uniref:uncharacterized protein LOC118488894 n=1 Tax=Helianthus annuus TaxID=4232 RepID=UPI001652D9AB|nr:uncharacterized protein LOC118488894 [Helianthus annuus]